MSLKELIKALQNPQTQRLDPKGRNSQIQEEKGRFSLIIVKTLTNNAINVFGIFVLGNMTSQETKQWYGNKENFVFSLHPTCKRYQYTR